MTLDESKSDVQRAAGISKTAVWVAAARAIGALEPDPGRAIQTTCAVAARRSSGARSASSGRGRIELELRRSDADMEVAGIVRAMAERTRFIDEALERAIGAGATQLLIPGAGFDSHAYRCRELLARARVFEVDRPGTLAFKRRRRRRGVGRPAKKPDVRAARSQPGGHAYRVSAARI